MQNSLPEDLKVVAEEIIRRINEAEETEEKGDQIKATIEYGSFCEYYKYLRERYNLSNSEIIKRGDIERSYYYQIIKGNRNPSRDKIIRICLGARLDPEEACMLLLASDYSTLYDFRVRDIVLRTALIYQLDVLGTNMLLDEFNVEPLK